MYEEEDPKFYNFQCEKPFLGNRHYERKGLAYCETHYHQVQKITTSLDCISNLNVSQPQLFGNLCQVCNQVIQTDVFTALNKVNLDLWTEKDFKILTYQHKKQIYCDIGTSFQRLPPKIC